MNPQPTVDQVMTYGAFAVAAVCVPFVLAALMRRLPGAARLDAPDGTRRAAWRSPIAACVAPSLGLLVLGLLAYRTSSELVMSSARARLATVATLKTALVANWLDDERDDILIWSASPQFAKTLAAWRDGGADATTPAGRDLQEHLLHMVKISHYASVSLRDGVDGRLLLATRAQPDEPAARAQAMAAARASEPLFDDLPAWPPDASAAQHDAAAQLGYDLKLPAGVVMHVAIDPRRELFPLFEQGSGDPDASELLLIRPEGNAMRVLNAPYGRRTLEPERDGIAARIAAEPDELLEGRDDRGRPVLGVARPVPGTRWFVLATHAEAAAFAALNRLGLLAGSLAVVATLLGFWWWVEDRRRAHAERVLVHERAQHGLRLAELSRRVVSAQEDERRRLAAELHDRTGANLAAIKLQLQSIAKALPPGSADVDERLRETGELLTDAIVSVREFCSDLRPSILDYAGLGKAIESIALQWRSRTGIALEIDRSRFAGRCAPEVETVLFRIAQEALLNCAKHANARTVRVRLARDDTAATLEIEDDGDGFDVARLGAPGGAGGDTGSGILNMRERAAFAAGRFELDAQPGRGTRISVSVPLAAS